MTRLLQTLMLVLLLNLGGCTNVFLQPDRVQHYPQRPIGTAHEDLWFNSSDGTRLHALRLPAVGAPRATILYLHGNAENLSTHIHLVSWLPAEGYQVLALDYRGYGQSEGERDLAGAHRDAEAALEYLLQQSWAQDHPVIVYGQSIGGAIAIRMLAASPQRARVRALISDSAFSSYRRIAREKLALLWLTWPLQWPLSLLISDQYAPEAVIGQLSPMPILLMQGDADVVVDVSHAQRLFAAAGEPKQLWIVSGGHHIDASFHPDIRLRLLDFLRTQTQSTD